ncbi:MAG TPA: DinB family protein [Candidatus Dormibacteraeota bacterium]|nr:DinB family protein [Candidatus Dormibacteraeota bacterium]
MATYTRADLDEALASYLDQDREQLAGRLEAVAQRTGELAARIGTATTAAQGWSAIEVLGHMGSVARAFGALTHRVASGEATQLDLLALIQGRDERVAQMSQLPVEELVALTQAETEKTAAFLRGIPSADLNRKVVLGEGMTWTAEEVCRLALAAHLESHLNQLESLLS